MPWDIADEGMEELARFGETVALLGFESDFTPTPTGDIVLWLYWKPLVRSDRPLKSFVHVYGEPQPDTGSILWSQDDQYPQGGTLSAADWQIGSVFRAAHYLPARSLESGEYRVEVGWYDPETGKRLTTGDSTETYQVSELHISAS